MSPRVTAEHSTARRAQILDAALSCFSRLGLDRATLRDISAESGLSLGTIYHYFPAKADLIEGLRAESATDEDEELFSAIPTPDSSEYLEFAVEFLFNRMQDPESADANRVAVMLWAHALLDERTRQGQLDALAMPREATAAAIRSMQERGLINPSLDAKHVGHVILAMLMGMQTQKTWEPEIDGAKAAAVAKAMLTGRFWTDVDGQNTNGDGSDRRTKS